MDTMNLVAFEFSSFAEYLSEVLSLRAKLNPRLSLRAFANHIGVSGSTLHDFCSGKRTPSGQNRFKVFRWLNLSELEEAYLTCLLELEQTRYPGHEESLIEKRAYILELHQNRKDIHSTLEGFELSARLFYSTPDKLNQRFLTMYRHKDLEKCYAYFDHNISIERRAAATAIALPNENSKSYRLLLDKSFNGEISSPIYVSPENRTLSYESCNKGLPRIMNAVVSNLGAEQVFRGDLLFSSQHFDFTGFEYNASGEKVASKVVEMSIVE